MEVTTEQIKNLRVKSGAGVMNCRAALIKAEGDLDKALDILKEQSLLQVEKKSKRVTHEGAVEAYIHPGSRVGTLIEVNCETDFVARTPEFKELVHNLAMQVAALSPQCVCQEDMEAGSDLDPKSACLLLQPYIKDTTKTVQDIVNEAIAKTGENIKIKRFARFELSEEVQE